MSEAPPAAPSEAPEENPPPTVTPLRVIIAFCLVAPFVALLWVSSYARTDPAFIGIPFFYWYQMLWVVVSAVLTMIAFQLWRRDQRARTGSRAGGASR
ncbi:DUF3311 domain-containing protein [Streptomyces sp. NBC_01317]|uniref:DUF3311 domain-containing protein n=1 Tax=Streptomyces sp. NBC_01317 TaxID=2903822 RepID=UPI002E12813A|nr:DUF3311 domain-containing protein [Streptomyces sp. NBC_01317]